MNNITLRVTTPQDELIDLDLYDVDPIKLTLSIEDITTSSAKSVISKTFRVPATAKNNFFFRNVFYVEGRDYDITKKNPAQILFNGETLREGHIRLVKVFYNRTEDRIEYEIIFLGELRDMASLLGDKAMCDLGLPDLVHEFSPQNIKLSWEADPQVPNSGLLGGNVVYPLIDFGNTYNQGFVQQTKIATSGSQPIFTSSTHKLQPDRFRPIIKLRAVVDRIFETIGYTYESQFINSYPFNVIYMAAHTSDAVVEFNPNKYSPNRFTVRNTLNLSTTSGLIPDLFDSFKIPFNVVELNESGNWISANSYYIAQYAGLYRFKGNFDIFTTDPISYNILFLKQNTLLTTIGPFFNDALFDINLVLNANDQIRVCIQIIGSYTLVEVRESIFQATEAPGPYDPSTAFDCNYKQIDFIKDILQKIIQL